MYIEKKICVVEDKSRKFKTYYLAGIKPNGDVDKFKSIDEYMNAESEKGFTDNEVDRLVFVVSLLEEKFHSDEITYKEFFDDSFGEAWPTILKSLSYLGKYPKSGFKVKNPRYTEEK